MNKFTEKLTKQYNIKGVGTFINVLYMTAPMLGIVMYIINAMTFYTVASEYIQKVIPWFTLPIFILTLVLGVILLLIFFYKFIYPNYYTFLNHQSYTHNNPIRKDLEMIKKHLGIQDDESKK